MQIQSETVTSPERELVAFRVAGQDYCVDIVSDYRTVELGFAHAHEGLTSANPDIEVSHFKGDAMFFAIRKPYALPLPECIPADVSP